MVCPYACTHYGKNLDDIQDEEFENCPGTGCATCECCVIEEGGQTNGD